MVAKAVHRFWMKTFLKSDDIMLNYNEGLNIQYALYLTSKDKVLKFNSTQIGSQKIFVS